MTPTTVLVTNRRLVSSIVSSLGESVRQQVEASIAERQREAVERAQHEAEEEARRRADEAWRAQRLAQRVPQAQGGLKRLLALSEDPQIVEMLRLNRELRGIGYETLKFYAASRPSGDAWDMGSEWGRGTRDVNITVSVGIVTIVYGSFAGLDTQTLKFNASESDDAHWAKLSELHSPYAERPTYYARHPEQRSRAWSPAAVAFQVLVSCARQRTFEQYLASALHKFNCP